MIELPMVVPTPTDRMDPEGEETRNAEARVARGFDHCHTQLGKTTDQLFITTAQVGALINVLHARGLVTEEEMKEQYTVMAESLSKLFAERRIGASLDPSDEDKYALPPDQLPVIDCESRYHLCHAACCALRFSLTRQDLDEGVMRWEYDQPYVNRVESDGHCAHLSRETLRCGIYAQRPAVCRKYSCRNDRRIWLDFERRVINPRLVTRLDDGRYRFHFEYPPEPADPPAAAPAQADVS